MKKIKFNPSNKKVLTYGECLQPAMKITNKEDAKQYKKDYVAYIQKFLDENPRKDSLTAEDIANHNIGYYAAYYDDETRKRVEDLFICKHPVFGSIKENGVPSVQKAFEMGLNSKEDETLPG